MKDERKILERVLEEATGFLDPLPGPGLRPRTDVESVATALRQPRAKPRGAMSVHASLQPDDHDSEQRSNAGAHNAACKAESTSSAGKEAVDSQQHSASDYGDPCRLLDLDAKDSEHGQDDGGDKGRRQDRPGLCERLFQCVDGVRAVFDGVTKGPSMDVR